MDASSSGSYTLIKESSDEKRWRSEERPATELIGQTMTTGIPIAKAGSAQCNNVVTINLARLAYKASKRSALARFTDASAVSL